MTNHHLQQAISRELTKAEERYSEEEVAYDADLLRLQADRDAALAALDPPVRLFCLVFIRTGNASLAAAEVAPPPPGRKTAASKQLYCCTNANAWLIQPDVQRALDLVCEVEQLKSGMTMAWKRAALKRIYDLTTDPENEKAYHPVAGTRAIELIAKLDDAIQGGRSSIASARIAAEKPAVTIQVVSGIQRGPELMKVVHDAPADQITQQKNESEFDFLA